MTYSLITLSHNKLACTRRCLSALLTDTLVDAPWEMIVVDNGSTDGSAEWCDTELVALGAAHGVPVTVLHNPGNIGCSFARNRAVAVARGTHLVFVDNDVAPRTRRWMQGLRAALESRPGVGMAGAAKSLALLSVSVTPAFLRKSAVVLIAAGAVVVAAPGAGTLVSETTTSSPTRSACPPSCSSATRTSCRAASASALRWRAP